MIIVMNGSCGVGKSTIARELTAKRKDALYIEGDTLNKMFDINDYSAKFDITHSNLLALCNNLISRGIKNIIVDYVFESIDAMCNFSRGINVLEICNIHFVTLFCSLEENLRRNSMRNSSNIMSEERIMYLNEIMGIIVKRGFGLCIDTTYKSVPHVVKIINAITHWG